MSCCAALALQWPLPPAASVASEPPGPPAPRRAWPWRKSLAHELHVCRPLRPAWRCRAWVRRAAASAAPGSSAPAAPGLWLCRQGCSCFTHGWPDRPGAAGGSSAAALRLPSLPWHLRLLLHSGGAASPTPSTWSCCMGAAPRTHAAALASAAASEDTRSKACLSEAAWQRAALPGVSWGLP